MIKNLRLIIVAVSLCGSVLLNAQTVYFSENFESTTGTAIPTTWSQTTAASDGGWLSGTGSGLSSSYFTIPTHTRILATNDDACNCDKGNDLLKTDTIDLSSATNPVLTFDLYYLDQYVTNQGDREFLTLEISTNAGTSWTPVDTLTASSWDNYAFDMTAFAGMANVMIGWRYNDYSQWAYGAALDNISIFEPPTKALGITNVLAKKYSLAGNQTIGAVIQSYGGPIVATASLKYSIDGGTPVQETFSPGITYSYSYTCSFTAAAALSTLGIHTVKVWIDGINGGAVDVDPSNDTATAQITIQATQPPKKVLIEEFTGAWCGYCPRGGVTLGLLTSADTNIIGAAIHDHDHMSTTEGNTVVSTYATGFPEGMIDRASDEYSYSDNNATGAAYDFVADDSYWDTIASIRKAEVVPATVALSAISYNTSTRQISATVTATFVGDVKGAFGINCYVTENKVYGPMGGTADTADNQWNQHSYYYDDPNSPFNNVGYLPDPTDHNLAYLRPNEYIHNHVVNKMMGGANGNSTTIPTTLVTAGQSFSKTFTYTLPASNPSGAHRYNPDNIYLVGIVQEYGPTSKANNYILNVTEKKLNSNPETALSVHNIEKTSFGSVSIYPNPASVSSNVAIELMNSQSVIVNVYNALGQVVFTENHGSMNAGNHVFNLNTETFKNGVYSVVITTGNGSITKKLSVNR
jgi:hypothetical protein